MGVGAGLNMYDVIVVRRKSSRSLSHLLMSSCNVSLRITTWTLIFSASGLLSNGKVNRMDRSLDMRTWRRVDARPLRDTGFL